MKHTPLIILLFLWVLPETLRAQVQPLFSQYMHDASVINPAYAGSADALAITLQARRQWQKTDGAPNTQVLSIHAPLGKIPLAAGMRLLHESVGTGRRMAVSPAFVYRLKLEKGSIAAGISANMNRYTPGYQHLLLYHKNDEVFTLNQPVWMLTLGAGFYYATNKFYAGLAVPEILPATRTDAGQNIFRRHLRQYVFHTGKVIALSEDVVLKPNLLISLPEQGAAYADLNLNALFRETLWLGASYRTSRLLAGLVQLQLNTQWRLGYSWDMPFDRRHLYANDSHEISLQYVFTFDRTDVRSPRYF